MGIFSFLSKSTTPQESTFPFKVDMHSHLIYDVDDGVKTLEESIMIIENLQALGYDTFITTPHIMNDFYKNSKDTLLPKRDEIIQVLDQKGIAVKFDVAAEYYLDDGFEAKLNDKENLLLIRDKYVLVETSYINAPHNLDSIIFEIQANGIAPILAHPERYSYMHDTFERYQELHEKGVLFQLNLNSLTGYYSKMAKDISVKLIDNNMVDFVGTDCHGEKHVDALKNVLQTKSYAKLIQQKLLNDTLA